MAKAVWNVEWLNANSQRSYPIASEATKLDLTGGFRIPDDFIIGLEIPIHAGLNVQPGKFFIRSIGVFSNGYRITVAYDDGSDSPPTVATGVVPKATHREFDSYAMVGQGDYVDTRGRIVIGRTTSIDNKPPGEYKFTLAGGRLEVDAIQPMIQYISGIVLVNGTERSSRLTGDIEIYAGTNFRTRVEDADTDTPKIYLDAIDGEGTIDECECDETEGPPIRTINSIPPDNNGNFNLLGSDCVSITALANGLKFRDTCSSPCCDCPELNALKEELKFFGSEARTTQNFINRLASAVDNMSNVILGSTLLDETCLSCETE